MSTPSSWWCLWQAALGTNGSYLSDPVLPSPTYLQGKWVIISGGNNGIGREAALYFAKKGANVILACRDNPPAWEKHPDVTAQECRDVSKPNGHTTSVIEWWPLNMADLASVEAFTSRWLETGRPLDILCNNAGVGSPPADDNSYKTKDGFEFIHQVNFLSHVLLTLKLLPSLAAAPHARIVCTTSCMHYLGKIDFDNFNWEDQETAQGSPYGNNKLYFQIWLTELQHRMAQSSTHQNIIINGVHPGFVKSGIWNSNRPGKKEQKNTWIAKVLYGSVDRLGVTTQQGSLAITHAAVSKDAGSNGGGKYFNRIWETPSMPQCHDSDMRLKIWNKVNQELGLEKRGLDHDIWK